MRDCRDRLETLAIAVILRRPIVGQDEMAWRKFAKKYNGSFKKGGYGFKLRGWYNKILKECPGAT